MTIDNDRRKSMIFGFSLLVSSLFALPSIAQEGKKAQITKEEWVHKGQQLRKEIENTYVGLKAQKKLKQQNDIADLVEKYIRIGESFEAANQILLAAGCTVYNPPNILWRAMDRFSLIGGAILEKTFPFKAVFQIILSPELPREGPNRVKRIDASINYSAV